MQIDDLSVQSLRKASLADIVEALLCRDPRLFRARLLSVDEADVGARLKEFTDVFGWRPPNLVEEWMRIEAAVDTSNYSGYRSHHQ